MVETEVAALIAPWLTPTSLFVLLNIVLATIFLANNKHHSQTKHDSDNDMNNKPIEHHYHHNQYDYYQNNQRYDYEGASLVPPPPQLVRAPSLFSRVASFNFSNFYSEAQPPSSDATDQTVTMTRAPSLLYRVTSFNFSRSSAPPPQKAVEEEARDQSQGHVMRENQKEVVEKDKSKEVKVKKKKAKKEVDSEVKKEVTAVKKEVAKETTSSKRVEEEEEVDSKADDFIHKFKQQLKLQRLESLLRYRNNPTPTAA